MRRALRLAPLLWTVFVLVVIVAGVLGVVDAAHVLGALLGPSAMALGAGAVYERNLPPPGQFSIDPVGFAIRTSRNRKPNPVVAWPGHATTTGQRIDAVGIVARIIVLFDGTATQGAGAVTATNQWPWNLIKSLTVSANGINNLFSCDGADLRALMRVRNAAKGSSGGNFVFDRESTFLLATSTTNTLRLFWEIPLAFDESLAGAVYAQTEETFLNVSLTTAASGDLFTANAPTIAGNFRFLVEFYSIPIVDTKAGRQLILPDITQLHGIVSRDDSLTGTGDHVAPLTRTGGLLLRSMQRIDNSTTAIGNVDPTASNNVSSHRFRYGGNVVPVEYAPASFLRLINEMDYNDALLPTSDVLAGAVPPAYMVDDFVIDSPMRDAVRMGGITEAQLINTISTGVTVVGGAKVHTVQEALVAS